MKASWVQFLAACELLGGILTLVGYANFAVLRPDVLAGWQYAMGIGFGLAAMFAGVQLMRERRIGYYGSLVIQGLQVVSFTAVPVARLAALAGLRAGVTIASNGLHVRVGGGGQFIAIPFARDGSLAAVGTDFDIGMRIAATGLEASTFTVGVNLIAVYFLWRLLSLRQTTVVPAAPVTTAPAAAI